MARGQRRSVPTKPTMKKAQAMVTNNRKKKAKKNMDTFFLKTKVVQTITPIQGATVSNYVYFSESLAPSPAINPYPGAYTQNAEFLLYKLQYDKFRVNSVKITVTPKANVLDQAVAQNDGNFNVTGDGLIHTCLDRDSNAPSSKAVISRYPSYKKYSVLKPFSRSYSIKYPMGVWLDCQSPGTFSVAQELGLGGSITLYAENLLEDNYEAFNEPWATVLIEHNIVFQGKTSNSLTGVYDLSGELMGVTINALSLADNKLPSLRVNVSGTLSKDTRTQDEITEVQITDAPDQ